MSWGVDDIVGRGLAPDVLACWGRQVERLDVVGLGCVSHCCCENENNDAVEWQHGERRGLVFICLGTGAREGE